MRQHLVNMDVVDSALLTALMSRDNQITSGCDRFLIRLPVFSPKVKALHSKSIADCSLMLGSSHSQRLHKISPVPQHLSSVCLPPPKKRKSTNRVQINVESTQTKPLCSPAVPC